MIATTAFDEIIAQQGMENKGLKGETRPANAPFKVMETSGLPYLYQVVTMAIIPDAAAARLVFKNITAILRSVPPIVLPALKPNKPNQRMKTPRAPKVKLCPGMGHRPFHHSFLKNNV